MAASLAERLAAWLSEQRGAPVEVRGLSQASAGARRMNALFEAVSVDGGVERFALTMIPSAAIQLLDVAGEAAVRTLAEDAGVPVPHVHFVCRDAGVIGGPFFISTAVDGETVPRRVLRTVQQHGVGERVVAQLGEAMARLHAVDASLAPSDLVRTTVGPIETQLRIVEDLLRALLSASPTFSYGARWLERHAPSEPTRTTIVHTDIRNGNIIVGDDGLRAILDWEGARIGDPTEDTAWSCQRMWRFREDDKAVGGMAGADVLKRAYESAGGAWDDDRFHWWRVLGTVRWGLSLAGQARSHLDGSFPSIVMAASGRRVPELEYDALLLLRP
jgi:aminoglycoside phosphotransferase (APT) family kinase protein